MKTVARRNIFIFSIFWLISLIIVNDLIERLLLFAVCVIVPLALLLTKTRKRTGHLSKLYVLAIRLHPIGALFAAVSLFLPSGMTAGILSLGWLLFTLLVAWYGLVRFLERGWHMLEETAIDVGLIYLAIGGGWFSISRFGIDVMHFGPTITKLTAIHFHFAAFVAPILIGLVGRIGDEQENHSVIYRVSAFGIMISPLLIAMGITYSRMIEFISVIGFAVALLFYCYQVITRVLNTARHFWARVFHIFSAVTLVFTIALACLYSLGRLLHVQTVSIPDMVAWHGAGNAFAFVLPGLIAWLMMTPRERYNLYGIPRSKIHGEARIGADFFARTGLVEPERHHKGLVDDFAVFRRDDFDPDLVHPSIRLFYEDTLLFQLFARTTWHQGFGLLSRLYKRISAKVEQLNLPLDGEEEVNMCGKIVSIRSEKDGRTEARGWVRTDAHTEKVIFAAIYSYHTHEQETYMNIALPYPFGNMTGILRLDHLESETGRKDGLLLTSLPRRGKRGDEGIYFHTKYLSVRLPLNERFRVRANDHGRLRAIHEMWLFGIRFLTINYEIEKIEREQPCHRIETNDRIRV